MPFEPCQVQVAIKEAMLGGAPAPRRAHQPDAQANAGERPA